MAKRTMKLQINTAGSWKDVVTFDAKDRQAVQAAAGLLARALGPSVKWCIVDDFGERHWLKFSDEFSAVVTDSYTVVQAITDRRESETKGTAHG